MRKAELNLRRAARAAARLTVIWTWLVALIVTTHCAARTQAASPLIVRIDRGAGDLLRDWRFEAGMRVASRN